MLLSPTSQIPFPQIPTRYDCVTCVTAKPRADCDCARFADPRRRATVGAVRGPAARAEALLLLLTGAWTTAVTACEAEAATAVAELAGLGEGLADASTAARVADGLTEQWLHLYGRTAVANYLTADASCINGGLAASPFHIHCFASPIAHPTGIQSALRAAPSSPIQGAAKLTATLLQQSSG
ncbi:MAG: hypothetical protein FRX49_04889 [Trebouxia sp. A1-2]|nr:MAG: hypothetical protein FRX49_04889 [Trebouxia sp. A1-2]